MRTKLTAVAVLLMTCLVGRPALAEGDWEITPQSEAALARGLAWLAENQGPEGNWGSNDLGLVSMGALAFLADGHTPGRGKYGRNVEKALNYVLTHAKPSGLLNMADAHRDMYNHGLSTFVLGQAYGMTNDSRIGGVLDRALKLIANTQCQDGGWDYVASVQKNGHDLSLAVMQAKALRSAVDSGFKVPPEVVQKAIADVRQHYSSRNRGQRNESEQQQGAGQFTYMKGGNGPSLAMAAAGVVCLQEFGQYNDWRIAKNMEVIMATVKRLNPHPNRDGRPGIEGGGYGIYYVAQALYQVGGTDWKEGYPILRDHLIACQVHAPGDPRQDGCWHDTKYLGGSPQGDLYATSCCCFALAIPNRYLPILQEGKIKRYQTKTDKN